MADKAKKTLQMWDHISDVVLFDFLTLTDNSRKALQLWDNTKSMYFYFLALAENEN